MAEVSQPVTLLVGGLANKQSPNRLGVVTPDAPFVRNLTRAENIDIDNNNGARMRQGLSKVYSGSPHSFWVNPNNDTEAYFVEGGVLKQLNYDFSATAVATMTNNNPMRFQVVNDDAVCTNGSNIGWIKSGAFVEFAPTLGEFDMKMPAGQFMAFFNGVLYVASGQVIYGAIPYKADRYDKRYGIYPMPAPIRMLGAVEDGLYVGTPYGVAFVKGGGFEDFVYINRTKPAFYGAFYNGYDFQDRLVCAWVSEDGIMLGLAGGQIERATPPEVGFPKSTQGSLFKTCRDGINQWIAVVHNPTAGNIYTPPDTFRTDLPGF